MSHTYSFQRQWSECSYHMYDEPFASGVCIWVTYFTGWPPMTGKLTIRWWQLLTHMTSRPGNYWGLTTNSFSPVSMLHCDLYVQNITNIYERFPPLYSSSCYLLTGTNHLTWFITHREAVFVMQIHSSFDAWHYEVLRTCALTRLLWYTCDYACLILYIMLHATILSNAMYYLLQRMLWSTLLIALHCTLPSCLTCPAKVILKMLSSTLDIYSQQHFQYISKYTPSMFLIMLPVCSGVHSDYDRMTPVVCFQANSKYTPKYTPSILPSMLQVCIQLHT
jgi:hypothetical protein